MIVSEPIGFLHNSCQESRTPEEIKKEISEIEVLPPFREGLEGIEQCEYLDVVFGFHQEKCTELQTRIRTGEMKGIFATRSPKRPNHIGITTVKLRRREGLRLYVEGADALDGSPILDIKSCDTSVFARQEIHRTIRTLSPRIDITGNILSNDTDALLLQAGVLHGHICPGLAIGVMAATRVMQQLHDEKENAGDYKLTTNMKNCPVDGFLFVTGCTPGTGRFIRSEDKTGGDFLLLTNAAGKGWRIRFKQRSRAYPESRPTAKDSPAAQGFATLSADPDEFFRIERTGKTAEL